MSDIRDLDDDELDRLATGFPPIAIATRAAGEIRRRRAADLTDDDREALRWARIHTINSMRPNDSGALRALEVLDRLIGGGRG